MTLANMLAADPMLDIRDKLLGPSLLSPFADQVARRLSRFSIGPLLEICCDTGVLTQAMAAALSAGMTIIATDPDINRVDFSAARPGVARVSWQQADPHALPFRDATFGIVACNLSVALLGDHVRVFTEARRVIKQGGRFLFTAMANIRQNPAAGCIQRAMDALFPDSPPRFLAGVLHGCAETEQIDDQLTEAGFTDAIYTMVDLPFAAASAKDVALGYCCGTGLRTEIEARAPGDLERVVQAAVAALERQFGTGPIKTTMRAHLISASG